MQSRRVRTRSEGFLNGLDGGTDLWDINKHNLWKEREGRGSTSRNNVGKDYVGTITKAYQYEHYDAMGDLQCELHQTFQWEKVGNEQLDC